MILTDRRVDIVGGGIGGLALAIGLLRQGVDVHVHEAAPSYAHVGGGHWLYANALAALDTLDPTLTPELISLGHPFKGFHFSTLSGTTLLHEGAEGYTPTSRHAPLVLHRADIIDRLQSRIPPERLHFNRRLSRIEGKTLFFESGHSLTCDLLIGADGIHSPVRKALLTPRPPNQTGQYGLWGIAPGTLDLPHARCFNELWGDGVRMGFSYVGGQGIYWFTVIKTPPLDTTDARREHILTLTSGFPKKLREVVRRTSRIEATPLWDVSPPDAWHTDWACCIGDAVHACTPNLGQGACQAIEDAACLSGLWAAETEPEVLFARLQRERQQRVTLIVYLARWLGHLGQLGGPLRWLRNLAVFLTPAAVLRPLLKWMMVGKGKAREPREDDLTPS